MEEFEFTNEAQKQYFQEAKLGLDIEQFLKQDPGRYLQGRAIAEYEAAKEELLKCNPDSFFGRRKIRKYQKQAEMADSFLKWCADAIANGRMAESLMDGE